MSDKTEYALLIDGDNVNTSYLQPLKNYVTNSLGGEIKATYLFGCLNSSYLDDWKRTFAEDDSIIKYDISPSLKNSADVRMLCVALQLYYASGLRNFIIMSSDCDMEALVQGLAGNANVVIAYSALRVSPKYLTRLRKHKVKCLDLDSIRGPLSSENIDELLQNMMQSYLQYKLGEHFFNYQAVLDWITTRYPELKDVALLQGRAPHTCFQDMKVSFTPEGAAVSRLKED